VPALRFLDDGSLLAGSADGLRKLGPDGCPVPESHALSATPIIALAHAPGAHHLVYAVAAGAQPGLWRSDDGGARWELRAPLATASAVSALIVSSSDAEHVYLSQGGPEGPLLRVSSDGGRSLSVVPQPFELTLLEARSGPQERLWAQARDALSMGNRGRAILRADGASAAWQTPLRVAYFGGLVSDAAGTIWVGDEIGGLYRSEADGSSFRKLPGDVPIGCLAQAGGALWACTPGTLDEPAIQRVDASAHFSSVVALPEVEHLVTCAPELEVERVCAAAWAEWKRDVLRLPVASADAGAAVVAEDAGAADASQSESSAQPTSEDAMEATADATSTPMARSTPDCAVARGQRARGLRHWLALASLSVSLAWRRRRPRLR
jgi:hypothetical protein